MKRSLMSAAAEAVLVTGAPSSRLSRRVPRISMPTGNSRSSASGGYQERIVAVLRRVFRRNSKQLRHLHPAPGEDAHRTGECLRRSGAPDQRRQPRLQRGPSAGQRIDLAVVLRADDRRDRPHPPHDRRHFQCPRPAQGEGNASRVGDTARIPSACLSPTPPPECGRRRVCEQLPSPLPLPLPLPHSQRTSVDA